jgi:hypothetical protein
VPGVLPPDAQPGLHEVDKTSPLFSFCEGLCLSGGRWYLSPTPVVGYRLVAVQAVVHTPSMYTAYEHRQQIMLALRQRGGLYFNFPVEAMEQSQLEVLRCLSEHFHERSVDTDPKAPNTFYCFHGPRTDHIESICSAGLVGTGGIDAGYFGSGCYSTLNIEYAIKHSQGVYDEIGRQRIFADGPYPVIMFAAAVGMVYPVTPELDYVAEFSQKHSNFYGRPLRRGFDCHVACVSEGRCFEAVSRDECEYMEVVIDQQSQMLPLAVMWFEVEDRYQEDVMLK